MINAVDTDDAVVVVSDRIPSLFHDTYCNIPIEMRRNRIECKNKTKTIITRTRTKNNN